MIKKIIGITLLLSINLFALEVCGQKVVMYDMPDNEICPEGTKETTMKNWTILNSGKEWSQQTDSRVSVCVGTEEETENCLSQESLSPDKLEEIKKLIKVYDSGTLSSCIEIKKEFPNSETGVYKLKNEEMVYCDMETDGGGWTLVDSYAPGSLSSYWTNTRTRTPNLDPNQTKPTLLKSYKWSSDPQLLCKSENYTGKKPWLTFRVLSETAKRYPTVADAIPCWGCGGHFDYAVTNGNTLQGLGTWIRVASGRIGTIWIGNGSYPTCACGYTNNPSTTGLGRHGIAKGCSVWVR